MIKLLIETQTNLTIQCNPHKINIIQICIGTHPIIHINNILSILLQTINNIRHQDIIVVTSTLLNMINFYNSQLAVIMVLILLKDHIPLVKVIQTITNLHTIKIMAISSQIHTKDKILSKTLLHLIPTSL